MGGFTDTSGQNYSGPHCKGVVVDGNAKFVLLAEYTNALGGRQLMLQRYWANGALDVTFGAAGTFTFGGTFANYDRIGLQAQRNGKYLVTLNQQILRVTNDGAVDNGFGVGGEVVLEPGARLVANVVFFDPFVSNAVVSAPDSTILITGFNNIGGNYQIFVDSLNANGTRDTSFGGPVDGISILPPHTPAGPFADAYAISIRADGRLLIGGTVLQPGSFNGVPGNYSQYSLSVVEFNPGADSEPAAMIQYPLNSSGLLTSQVSGVAYMSPDGTYPSGGGNTVRVYGGTLKATRLLACGNGVVTVFNNIPTIAYFSPDGTHLGGGGSTRLGYNGPLNIGVMTPYQGGLITAFSDHTIWQSSGANCQLQGTQVASSTPYDAISLVSSRSRVVAAFNNGEIWFSPDGTHLFGGGSSTRLYGGPGAITVLQQVTSGDYVLTAFNDGTNGIYVGDLRVPNINIGVWGAPPQPSAFLKMSAAGSGVLAQWNDANKTIHYSTTTPPSNLAGATTVYSGGRPAQIFVPTTLSRVITSFGLSGIYRSDAPLTTIQNEKLWYVP